MMNQLQGKTAFITGVSAGIGKAAALALGKEGANLILSARRKSIVDKIATEIRKKYGVKTYEFMLDVRNSDEVQKAIDSLPEEWKNIDILINNAGLARGFNKMYEDDIDDWNQMIDTNIKGLLYVTRSIVPGMIKRKTGHIINIGSIAGHQAYPNGAVYASTKHAVNAITQGLRMDLLGSGVRVSTVETEFSVVRFHGDLKRAKKVYEGFTPLMAEDIAEAVIFCATRPPHVNINELIIMPTAQASAYHIHRKD